MDSKRLTSVFLWESRMLFGCVTVGLGEGLSPEKKTDTVNRVHARISEN